MSDEKAQNPETEAQNPQSEEANTQEQATEQPQDSPNAQETQEAPQVETRIVEENIDYKDKYIRLSAEFDNYRKRTLKERLDTIKTASATVLEKLLPVVDNFERALKSTENAKDVQSVAEGIKLIYTNFQEFLKQNGLKEIEALHHEFDVDKHEALTKIPAPSPELKGKIVDVIEKGYTLNDKVVRYAKVVLGE